MAKDFKRKDDRELIRKIKHDMYMFSAVIECYETLRVILNELVGDEDDKVYVKCFVIISYILIVNMTNIFYK